MEKLLLPFFFFLKKKKTGHVVDQYSYQLARVLPARRRDHSSNVAGCAAFREIPNFRHDSGLYKVSEFVTRTNLMTWTVCLLIHPIHPTRCPEYFLYIFLIYFS